MKILLQLEADAITSSSLLLDGWTSSASALLLLLAPVSPPLECDHLNSKSLIMDLAIKDLASYNLKNEKARSCIGDDRVRIHNIWHQSGAHYPPQYTPGGSCAKIIMK
jgi:hypothetical protein